MKEVRPTAQLPPSPEWGARCGLEGSLVPGFFARPLAHGRDLLPSVRAPRVQVPWAAVGSRPVDPPLVGGPSFSARLGETP